LFQIQFQFQTRSDLNATAAVSISLFVHRFILFHLGCPYTEDIASFITIILIQNIHIFAFCVDRAIITILTSCHLFIFFEAFVFSRGGASLSISI